MATLQNIRSKGPLLVIVIGLALFAFIAGDAWKVLQPHQSQNVGEVNGEELSAQEYQQMVEEYSEVIKISRGLNALNDQQMDQIRDEVWRSYVNNQLIESQAQLLGLTVTADELESMLNDGVHPLLQQTPFYNPQTGRFDRDMLNKFLVEYNKMSSSNMPAQYTEQYTKMYKYWSFIEKTLIQTRLAQKYQALISNSLMSNPVEAKAAFNGKATEYNLLLAGVPYSAIPDSAVNVTNSDIEALYDQRKEQFRQYVETRDIKYIDVEVTASKEDRAAIQEEIDEYTEELAKTTSDYTSFIRSTGSQTLYKDLYCTKDAFPADVIARLDSANVNSVYGSYYNSADNTLNSFKILGEKTDADSIQYRQIQVMAENIEKTRTLADSISTALNNGAKFEELAKKYGQTAEARWLSSAQYENANLNGDNLNYIKAVTTASKNKIENLELPQANIIFQVLNKKHNVKKYKIAVVKLPIDFSSETYNKVYNKFSQFIAENPSLEAIEKNAEEAGYRLLERNNLRSSEHAIAGVRGTKEALRWAFAAERGELSGLYECGEGNHMMVVGLEKIHPEGYRSVSDVQRELRAEVLKTKKAEKIIADIKSLNAKSIAQVNGMANAVSDTLKHVTFAAPAYVAALRSSEPLVSAYASVAQQNVLSAPIEGNAGVFVLQLINKEETDLKFNEKEEQATLLNMDKRFASRFVNSLYLKADVKDNRYLFF